MQFIMTQWQNTNDDMINLERVLKSEKKNVKSILFQLWKSFLFFWIPIFRTKTFIPYN